MKQEKPPKDKRINAGLFSFKEYMLFFVLILFTSTSYNSIFEHYMETSGTDTYTFTGAILGSLLFSSFVAAIMVGVGKRVIFGRPIRKIAQAARQITEGDFSVRLQPFRKDGKKDELEVLVEDFNTMAEELSTIETLKTDFIANVSHEIKSPLAVIQSYATAIQDDSIPAEQRIEYGKTIVEASQKLSALVTNILKLNKLDNQEIYPEAQPYVLGEQLGECAVAFEEQWDKKNITFEADMDYVVVNYDRDLLDLVWNNLISNAIKFTDNGGMVTVTLKAEKGATVVTVKDTGCGMDEKTANMIFDKFYQGDTSHSTEGNGLGLALAKKVIDLVGGEIGIQSQPGAGTTFTVRLSA